MVGLPGAFLQAGAGAVLAPQGSLDDVAASAFVQAFFRIWNPKEKTAEPAISAAHALRLAQAEVRAQPRWKHPYYWAGWTLFGDAN